MKKFLGKDRKKSPNPKEDNPYAAQEPPADPYMAPSNVPQSRPGGLPSGPRAGRVGGGLPGGPSPRVSAAATPPPPYQAQPSYQSQQQQPQQQRSQGYGSDRYGASGGYGSNRYGDDKAGGDKNGFNRTGPSSNGSYGGSSMAGSRGPGGYGGLGRTDSNDTETKDALFGGAKDRYASHQNPNQGPNQGPSAGPRGGYGAAAAPGPGLGPAPGPGGNKYGGYGEERELSEHERIKLEERDLARQVDEERDATLETGNRINRIIFETIETASGTLRNMEMQDERLRNTERHLDLAAVHNRTAEERTKELKHYNRSLWNPGNPFMGKSKAEERERKLLEQHQMARAKHEETEADAFQSKRKYEQDMRRIEQDMSSRKALGLSSSETAAQNNKFVFDESDDEDDNPENLALRADRRNKEAELNNVIIPQMQAGVQTLNNIARSFQPRIEESNALIDRIGQKSDVVDDGVRMNRAKLDNIYKRG